MKNLPMIAVVLFLVLAIPIILWQKKQPSIHQTPGQAMSTPLAWPRYTFTFGNLRLSLQSNTPVTSDNRIFSDRVAGGWQTLLTDVQIFKISVMKECTVGVQQPKDPCFLSRQWEQSDIVVPLDSLPVAADSSFVLDPASNTVLHVVQLHTTPPLQLIAPVDGGGLEQDFQRTLRTIVVGQ